MGTAVVRAIFRPWNDACMSDIVLLGVILPPAYLKVCVYVRVRGSEKPEKKYTLD